MPFVHDASLKFPRLTQINLPSGRVYRVEEGDTAGEIYPSITRALSKKEKPGLEAWKVRVGAEEASLVSSRATVVGSNLHKLAECYVGNDEIPRYGYDVAERWQYLRPWLNTHITKVYQQESDLFSRKLGIAGRTDLLGQVDGINAVVDFKQANRPKKDEYIEDYYLQGTFYAFAAYELTGLVFKRIVIPVASPEGLQVFETSPTIHFEALMDRITEFWIDYSTQAPLDKAASVGV